jgi:hypothetical protein
LYPQQPLQMNARRWGCFTLVTECLNANAWRKIIMDKHTQGPWKAIYVGCGDWDLNGPVTQEDWVLAAAAPELLEALRVARHMIVEDGTPIGWSVDRLSEVIAKATGEHHG